LRYAGLLVPPTCHVMAFQGAKLKRYSYIADNPLLPQNETYIFLITCRFVLITEGPVSQWRSVIDVNLLGLSIFTKEALQSMKERGVDDGHIIHISRCPTLTTVIHSFSILSDDRSKASSKTVSVRSAI
jgi:hypothetical protein